MTDTKKIEMLVMDRDELINLVNKLHSIVCLTWGQTHIELICDEIRKNILPLSNIISKYQTESWEKKNWNLDLWQYIEMLKKIDKDKWGYYEGREYRGRQETIAYNIKTIKMDGWA